MEECCGAENCGNPESHDDTDLWIWGAVAAGAILGAVGIIWLMQYRKPDRSMDRLLRRANDRIEDIETTLAALTESPAPEPEA